MPETTLEGGHPRISSAKLGWNWLSSFREEDLFLISSPYFYIFSLASILVGNRDHRTQFWKGAIQGPFHQSVVAIGTVVSEEKIFMWISQRVPCWAKFGCGGHLGRRAQPPNTFWKRTIQWLFHQNLLLIEQMVSDKKIFMGISHRVLC